MVTKDKGFVEQYKYAVLVGAGSLVIALVLIFMVGSPLWKSYKESSRVLTEKKAVLAKLEQKLEKLKNLKSQEADLKTKNEKVVSALPTDKDVSRLFVQFENIASQNKYTIDSVSEGGAASGTNSTEFVKPVSYTVTGNVTDYASFKGALLSLEKALRILNVSNISLNNLDDGLSGTLTVSTYVRNK
jgi:Tfp pilus assembly protein PilO